MPHSNIYKHNILNQYHLIYFFTRIREALEKLNELVDESDPDIGLPNIIHAFQCKIPFFSAYCLIVMKKIILKLNSSEFQLLNVHDLNIQNWIGFI